MIADSYFCVSGAVDNRFLLEPMETFKAIAAFAFAIPILLILGASARLYLFWRDSCASTGQITVVQTRDWIDQDAYPVKRYFASVHYVAAGVEYSITDWGPHEELPTTGTEVAIRYLRSNPRIAKIWTIDRSYSWLLVPLLICILIEVLVLRA